MTMLPGTPQLTNIVPTTYLGTTPMAAPIIGIIGSILALIFGIGYIHYAVQKTVKKNEGFYPTGKLIAEAMPMQDLETNENIIKCLIPCIVLIIVMNAFGVSPTMSLVAATIVCYLIFFRNFKGVSIRQLFVAGSTNAVGATCNTSSVMAFGAVVSSVAGYQLVVDSLQSIPGPPIVQMLVAIEIAAGVTGSSSGGIGIALNSLGSRFLEMGIPAEAIHRLGAMAAGGLDSLPHTSGLYTSLTTTKLTHAQAYKHMFWLTVILPIIVVIICTIIYVTTGIL